MLLAPSANRVYASATPQLACAELAVTSPDASEIEVVTIAGVEYLSFRVRNLDAAQLANLAEQSTALALFERAGILLRPLELPNVFVLDEDLVTIPKYQGKTNEMFTRLLMNATLAQVTGEKRQLDILDPLAGRGTTLLTAWLSGHNGYGVEADEKAFEAMAAYVKTWLRRKRLKHTADISPVRREGKSIGRRFDATVKLPDHDDLTMTVFTGDTTASAALFGKKKFDAIVTDAPYGVVHGSLAGSNKRDRSPATLLNEAVPVWSSQLKPGGALGLSWNTFGMAREALSGLLAEQELKVCESAVWRSFAHRVDSSINRDLMVACAR